MSTRAEEATQPSSGSDELEALIESFGANVAVWLLWLVPAVAFFVALARS